MEFKRLIQRESELSVFKESTYCGEWKLFTTSLFGRSVMKFSLGKLNPFGKDEKHEYVCKVCKMVFRSKESLDRHKTKANHVGAVNL